jgi:hypothetical protein
MLRGLFAASARNLAAAPPAPAPVLPEPVDGVPVVNDPVQPPMRSAVMAAALPAEANMEKSYPGGLVRYQRPDGQSGADRMALLGAMLGDIGAGLNGGQGGSLARVQEQFRARNQRDQAKSLMHRLYPDDPEAEAMFDIDPSALSRAWLESKKPVEWQHVEADDGLYLYNPRTREREKIASWTRKQDDPIYQEYLQSQIEANKALAGQRQNQGAYYGAKARQPYAPPRASSGGGGGLSALSTKDLIAALRGQ